MTGIESIHLLKPISMLWRNSLELMFFIVPGLWVCPIPCRWPWLWQAPRLPVRVLWLAQIQRTPPTFETWPYPLGWWCLCLVGASKCLSQGGGLHRERLADVAGYGLSRAGLKREWVPPQDVAGHIVHTVYALQKCALLC